MGRKGDYLTLRAPAKINWFLKITGKREDGYHNIISLIQCISLYDNLVFEHADTLKIISDLDIPLDDNLVYKAASLLRQYTSYKKGAKIVLQKDIPVGAGIGGGSSNAAYTLSGLNLLWGLELNNKELSSIGAEIGSDVPFFLNGPFAVVEGRGEKISPFEIQSSTVLFLVKPPISVSTAWAYSSFDRLRMHGERSTVRSRRRPDEPLTKKAFDIKLFCQLLKKQDFASLSTMLNNDLENVVIKRYPIVSEIKKKLLGSGAIISVMSGSGPTVFGVFDNKDKAEKAVKAMMPFTSGGWCKVVETLTTVNSQQ